MKTSLNKYISVCVLAVASILPTHALTIDEAARMIASSEPSILAADAQFESELAARRADNLLEPAEVEVEQLWGPKAEGNKLSVGVSQSFDWPGAYSARREATDALSQAVKCSRNAILLEKTVEAKLAILDIISLRRQIAVSEQMKANVDSLEQLTDRAWRMGETTILEVNRLRIGVLEIERSLSDLRRQYRDALAELTALNNGHDCSDIIAQFNDFPEMTQYSEAHYARMVDEDPSLKALYMRASAADLDGAAAKSARMPGFSVGYKYNLENGASFNGFSLGVRLPSFGPRYQEAEQAANAESLRAQFEAERVKLMSQMYSGLANAQELRRQIQIYSEALDNTDNIRLLNRALEGGQITLTEYLSDINFFLDAQKQYITARHDLAVTMTQLNRMDLY